MVARKHLPMLVDSVAGYGSSEWRIACGASRLRSPESGAAGGPLHHESATPQSRIRFDESAQGTLRWRRRVRRSDDGHRERWQPRLLRSIAPRGRLEIIGINHDVEIEVEVRVIDAGIAMIAESAPALLAEAQQIRRHDVGVRRRAVFGEGFRHSAQPTVERGSTAVIVVRDVHVGGEAR